MTDALIKELREDLAKALEGKSNFASDVFVLRRMIAELELRLAFAYGDAASMVEASMLEYAVPNEDRDKALKELAAEIRLRQPVLSGHPVAPVVDDAMVEAALNAPIPGGSEASWWFIPPDAKVRENPELHEKARENIRDVAKRMLMAALNVSQPTLKLQEAAPCKICGDQSGICRRLDQPDCPRKAVAYSQTGVK